jgi:hypothetical protein
MGQKVNKEIFPAHYMLRANGQNLKDLLWIVRKALHEKRDFIQLVIHSPELMPGGSLKLPNKKAVEKLYKDLEFFFDHVYHVFESNTLQEYHGMILNNRKK